MALSDINDIDKNLNELERFGKYQIANYFLICLPIFLSAFYSYAYVFTAGNLEYRCKIPECDNSSNTYDPDWLKYAIPNKNNKLSSCYQYKYIENSTTNDQCSIENFNHLEEIRCNDFIYNGTEKTIVNEWNITCDENQWMLTLVGTINNIGQFIALPLSGFISDRYGRRFAFVMSIVLCGIMGLLRSLSTSYPMFLAFEFLEPALGSGIYPAAFILGMELVGPSQRVFGGIIISIAFALGGVMLGFIAMNVTHWRTFLQVCYSPTLIFIIYSWLLPESFRWLITKGRYKEATEIILKTASWNKIGLSEGTIERLFQNNNANYEKNEKIELNNEYFVEKPKKISPIREIFQHPTFLIRVANCSFCWLTNTFVYYGLTLNSVSISGNKYVNFMLLSLIEIPGFGVTYILSERIGRRWTLCSSLILSGLICICTEYAPKDMPWLTVFFFLIGKFAITVSFTVLYIYTAELFPTNLRHSLLGICSMFGRFGSMLAPQTPLLARYSKSLPLLLMGALALLSGTMSLQFPETLNTQLPDTVEQALSFSKKSKKVDKLGESF